MFSRTLTFLHVLQDLNVPPCSPGKWVTRFGQSGAMEEFQVEGGAPVRVPMMHQDNYPMKLGIDSDLGCTVINTRRTSSASLR